jgi:hypothetical protein
MSDSEPLPMLRYVLAFAIEQVRDKNLSSHMDVPSRFDLAYEGENAKLWTKGLQVACFGIIGNSLPETDRYVVLIRRACRMLAQSGEILWDEPANQAQQEQEQEWLGAAKRHTNKVEHRQNRRAELARKRAPIILTEEQKKALLTSPLLPDHLIGRRAKETCTKNLPWMNETFYHGQTGSYWGDWDYSVIFNKMIETGIVDLVEVGQGWKAGHASYGTYRLGPRFLDYMHRWQLKPQHLSEEHWRTLIKRLNKLWGTKYKPEDFNNARQT